MIRAEARSDDGACVVEFDAISFFEGATDEEIAWIVKGDFAGGALDNIVYRMEDCVRGLASMLAYCEGRSEIEPCGFECAVNPTDVRTWIEANRPHLSIEQDGR